MLAVRRPRCGRAFELPSRRESSARASSARYQPLARFYDADENGAVRKRLLVLRPQLVIDSGIGGLAYSVFLFTSSRLSPSPLQRTCSPGASALLWLFFVSSAMRSVQPRELIARRAGVAVSKLAWGSWRRRRGGHRLAVGGDVSPAGLFSSCSPARRTNRCTSEAAATIFRNARLQRPVPYLHAAAHARRFCNHRCSH